MPLIDEKGFIRRRVEEETEKQNKILDEILAQNAEEDAVKAAEKKAQEDAATLTEIEDAFDAIILDTNEHISLFPSDPTPPYPGFEKVQEQVFSTEPSTIAENLLLKAIQMISQLEEWIRNPNTSTEGRQLCTNIREKIEKEFSILQKIQRKDFTNKQSADEIVKRIQELFEKLQKILNHI